MESVQSQLHQGLIIASLGMSLVFCALGLLWGIISLLTRIFAPRPAPSSEPEVAGVDPAMSAARSAERARVAALVAGAFIANALPMLREPPAGPTFEDGRSAPSWVTARRAHTLRAWQPRHRR